MEPSSLSTSSASSTASLTQGVPAGDRYLSPVASDRAFVTARQKHHLVVDAKLQDYILSSCLRTPPIFSQLVQATVDAGFPAAIATAPDQTQFMGQLIKFGKVKRIIEIGVFTGYSSLGMALALPEDGKLIALDINPTWTDIARRFWKEAGVDHKVELRLGHAVESLDHLLNAEKAHDTFDFAFIDADKLNYYAYYERVLQLVRVGGMIVVDNVLWQGQVANDEDHSADTVAIRAFNEKLSKDERIELTMLGMGDGVTVAFRVK
eukprot:TRINITY_DN15114_c0_g1_i1.p1 TRINITY_DN15114_c0_g1~~TRINITY_DN15114_c0_g1_i1.p1  ORF type:complete len:279 (+),score=62.83 TRINITY_DN15114_c0_g1_i1:47-838(+)